MRLLLVIVLIALTACATTEWDRVRNEDTSAEYRRFAKLRPDSPHREEALERAGYLDLRDNPSWEAFERFRSEYPHSGYLRRAALLFEDQSFERARRLGTESAYRDFLQTFSDGENAQNARAAVEYLSNDGFSSDPEALAAFIARYPGTEYAEEGKRGLEIIRVRNGKRYRRIGLRITLDGSVQSPDRVRRTFTDRARQAYAGSPVQLITDGSGQVEGWIDIQHREVQTKTEVTNGTMLPPGVIAETDLTFAPTGIENPIFRERFELRVSNSERRGGNSILFSPRAEIYWSKFFVPVASWPTQLARRGTWSGEPGMRDVHVDGDRAIALFRDGSFKAINLADPSQPATVAQYRGKNRADEYGGVRRYANAVVAYGQDGIRVTALAEDGNAVEVSRYERGDVGAVVDLDRSGNDLLAVTARSLLRVPIQKGSPEVLISGQLRAIDRSGPRVYLVDDHWLYMAPVERVSRDTLVRVARFERGFDAKAVRANGTLVAVIGAKEVLCIHAPKNGRGRILSRLQEDEVGKVSDVAILSDRVFILGNRGLQVVDPVRGRVIDSVDVDARSNLAADGRLLVAAGDATIEMVDASAWIQPRAAASQR